MALQRPRIMLRVASLIENGRPGLSPMQQIALATLPNVTSRRSRYYYGIKVNVPVAGLDLDAEDNIKRNPEGTKVTSRMRWHPSKGDKIDKTSRIPITYHQFHRAPLPPKCTFDIMYSPDELAPKRVDSKVFSLCRIECGWGKPIWRWKAVGDPSMGWRKHEDLALTMGLKGETKWEIRVGSNKTEHGFDVECMG
ncbi:hypothetical protein B0J13DRAFT_678599 [Dactylonectria estremocensis]|uniref:Uncharacterized protein n=1 Tax=Dactylonectria estremocensis TaxID=1079267 RepID=A0A9P9IUG5_9HYPO|nr:hypothetical protein B0J13DRAFT_678599 [Dactylonectria estremocensis]